MTLSNRILLLGKTGQVGWELVRTLAPLGEVTALGSQELDLADLERLRSSVEELKPHIIVNAAAYTDVDGAEAEPDLANAVNAAAPGVLAEEARRAGALFVHYSTDFVFGGGKNATYTESDEPNPINAYGRSKLNGERAIQQVGGNHFILRTSWVYSTRRVCFVTKVLRWAREQEVLRIVEDQRGSPTWCRSLAEATALILAVARERGAQWLKEHSGVYHLACPGSPSRFELAEAVLELDPRKEEQKTREITPASSEEFPTAAQRPVHSALDSSLLEDTFGLKLPPWRKALTLAMGDLGSGH